MGGNKDIKVEVVTSGDERKFEMKKSEIVVKLLIDKYGQDVVDKFIDSIMNEM